MRYSLRYLLGDTIVDQIGDQYGDARSVGHSSYDWTRNGKSWILSSKP